MQKHQRIYKICKRDAWDDARRTGELAGSEADLRDGYVHLSSGAQVHGTALKHFRGERELVLLEVPVERLPASALKWEVSRNGEPFPHLYGPLRSEYVERTYELSTGEDGLVALPDLP